MNNFYNIDKSNLKIFIYNFIQKKKSIKENPHLRSSILETYEINILLSSFGPNLITIDVEKQKSSCV